jgi:hypothetical protein
MTDWNLPWSGGCRCNKSRIVISKAPLLTMACHCTGCQRMSASAFSLSIAVPAGGFEVTAGAPILGGLNRDMHYFCPVCMSWMFTRPNGMEWFVNVRVPLLDDHHWVEPFVETYTAEKLSWASTPAKHSYKTIPELSVYEGLVREFAAEGRRPHSQEQ